jgi:hypothetical protein
MTYRGFTNEGNSGAKALLDDKKRSKDKDTLVRWHPSVALRSRLVGMSGWDKKKAGQDAPLCSSIQR